MIYKSLARLSSYGVTVYDKLYNSLSSEKNESLQYHEASAITGGTGGLSKEKLHQE